MCDSGLQSGRWGCSLSILVANIWRLPLCFAVYIQRGEKKDSLFHKSNVELPSGFSGWVGVPFVQVPVHGWRRYRSLHWVSSVSVQVYCELLARVPVTTTPAPLFEYLTPRGKAL